MKKTGCRRVFGGLITLMLLAGLLLAAGAWRLHRLAHTPLAGLDADAHLLVARGDSFNTVIHKLRAAGVQAGHPLEWRLLARYSGAAGRIKAGEYALKPGITPLRLLEDMRDGKVVNYRFTLVEGWTFRDVRRALARAPHLAQESAELSDAELMAAIGKPGEHPEGRFLPETYQYHRGESDLTLLHRAYAAMETLLADVWQTRDPALPLKTPYELLTLASIVEKETGIADERAQIAGVFARRLAIGMRLETDPTIIYGLGDAWNGKFTWAHLRTDGPYNTRTRAGLPPTPIAMPGRAALRASAHPAEGDALFFVAIGDGSGRSRFARTYPEHQRNVAAYLANRRNANAGEPVRGTAPPEALEKQETQP